MCGSSRFIPARALKDDAFGFLKDGYFTIKVEFAHVPRAEADAVQRPQDRRILRPTSDSALCSVGRHIRFDAGPAGVRQNGMIHVHADRQRTICMHCHRQIRAPLSDGDLV